MNSPKFSVFTIRDGSMKCVFPRNSVTGRAEEEWMGNIGESIEYSNKVESSKMTTKVETIVSFKRPASIETVTSDLFKLLSENDWSVIGFVGSETFRNLVCVKQTINVSVIFNKIRDQIESVTDEDFIIENSSVVKGSKL